MPFWWQPPPDPCRTLPGLGLPPSLRDYVSLTFSTLPSLSATEPTATTISDLCRPAAAMSQDIMLHCGYKFPDTTHDSVLKAVLRRHDIVCSEKVQNEQATRGVYVSFPGDKSGTVYERTTEVDPGGGCTVVSLWRRGVPYPPARKYHIRRGDYDPGSAMTNTVTLDVSVHMEGGGPEGGVWWTRFLPQRVQDIMLRHSFSATYLQMLSTLH